MDSSTLSQLRKRFGVDDAKPINVDHLHSPISLVLAGIAREALLCNLRRTPLSLHQEAILRTVLSELREWVHQ